jgi:hypothetical protein
MRRVQVRLRQSQVGLHHLQRCVPQRHLELERVAAIAQEIHREGVPESVWVQSCTPALAPRRMNGEVAQETPELVGGDAAEGHIRAQVGLELSGRVGIIQPRCVG